MGQKPRSFSCPICGEDVPAGARACPECGACEKSGWSADAGGDGLGLPEEEFDYDQFVAEEFEGGDKKRTTPRIWVVAAIMVLIALAWGLIGSCR